MKLFLKKILAYILPIILIVFLVNLISDPASLFKGIELKIATDISNGFNVTGVANIDERILQKKVIENIQNPPETIILGSSRIMMVGRAYYGIKSRNNGVSGASLEDIIAIYQIYKEEGIKPKKFVIGVDPWLFNQNNGQSRWLSIKNDYDRYYNEESNQFIVDLPIHKYEQLFSLSYFQASIKSLSKNVNNNKPIATQNELNNTLTRLIDGTITYGNDYRTKSGREVEDAAKNYINGNIYSIENFNDISEEIKTKFENFIVDLLKNGIEIEFLLMPYHPIVWQHIEENEKYKAVQDVESYMYNFANKNSIKITGSYNPEPFMLSSTDFYDGMHLSPDGIKKVLK